MSEDIIKAEGVNVMNSSQLLKGTLEGCVLLVINKQEIYGYELVTKLRQLGFLELSAGTVYPLLQKLEKNGTLTSRLHRSSEGPQRKYYRVTAVGQKKLQEFITDWQQLTTTVATVIEQMGE